MKISTENNIHTAVERKVLFGSQAEKIPAEMPTPVMKDVVLSAGVVTCGHDSQWAQFLKQPTEICKTRK